MPNTVPYFNVARPVQIIDRDGYTQTLIYATDGSLQSVTDSFGRQMTFTWYPFHVTNLSPPPANALPYPMAIKEITLPDGTKLRYSYDPAPTATGPTPTRAERLVKVERLDATNIVVDQTTYLYEDARFRTHLTGWIDHKGVRLGTYAYDALGRAISTERANGTDRHTVAYAESAWYLTRTVTNPLGKVATYTFTRESSGSARARLTSVNSQPSTNCPASATAITYNANRFIATETDEEGRVTAYVRDVRGRPTSITRGSGTPQAVTATMSYHATLNVPASVVEPGRTTSYT